MEPRQLLAAAPLYVGAVYIEEDIGSDVHGDTFEITFEDGAPSSELTRVEINGDQNAPGFGVGDVFFDTSATGLGADRAFPFTVISLQAANPSAFVRATVEDGSSLLVLDLIGFQAGDKLTFSIDVDEVEDFDPSETDLAVINDGFDPIASGVEFQGSLFTASFSAPHYHDAEVTAEFRNRYDGNLAGSGLDLPADDEGGKRDRSAGVVGRLEQDPLPVAISGTVYLETDLDLVQDPGEDGIPDVELGLWERVGTDYRFSGHRATTNANGDYRFGFDLDLEPGTYQVREAQPDGLFSVGAIAGTVDGDPAGQTVAGDPDILTEIAILLGGQEAIDEDFAEAMPAAISGHVYHDRDNDGNRDAGEEGIGGVPIQVIPIQTIAAQGPVSVTTDASGFYQVTGLAPGTYRVEEIAQPDGYLDGLDTAGTVNGESRGAAVNPGDNIETIFLGGGQAGIDYDFGELMPVSIEGRVLLTDPFGNCYGAGADERPIEGATVRLLDSNGQVIDETSTDGNGSYRFDGMFPGTYSVVEVTPAGLIDGEDHVGTVGGTLVGTLAANDTIAAISLASGENGVDYDFCEYQPASLSGHVYHDRDNDGLREGGEEGIGSVRVTLLDSASHEVRSTTTDPSGFYEFNGLAAGVYSIVETHPDGWVDGLDRAGTIDSTTVGNAVNPGDRINAVDLRWGDRGVDYDFGELRYAFIQGRVILTTPDGDCYTSTTSQRGLPGVTVLLQDDNGTTIAQTTTDAQGNYRFDDLLPGTYTVIEVTPNGLIDGEDHVGTVEGVHIGDASTNDTIRAIALTSGQGGIDYDFCEHEPACLSGYVYHDENDNGAFDSGEDPIAGATVRLLDSSGTFVAAEQTDANGFYQFCDLPAGTFTVVEMQPTGYLDGTDSAGTVDGTVVGRAVNPGDQIREVQLNWGDDAVQYNFGELLTGSIEGFVHTEFGDDCVFDDTEDPIAGVTVELLNEDGRVIATTQTDANGHYKFDDLRPGVYTVREQQPAGYFHVGQLAGSGGGDDSLDDIISAVAIGSGERLVDYNFCEVPPSSIEGTVHTDLNGDCVFDPDEAPLAGVTIELINDRGEVMATTETDADGHYRFDNLRAGTYTVREQQPEGYLQGGQEAGSHGGDDSIDDVISAIAIPPDQQLVEYDFCETIPGRLSGYVFQDGGALLTADGQPPSNLRDYRDGSRTADDKPLGGVVLELRDGISGDAITADRALPGLYADGPIRTTTDENGFYEFNGLPRGNYAVYEIHPQGYFDGIDTPGTTSGIAINPSDDINPLFIQRLSKAPENDAIILIPLPAGGASENNNFSEVVVQPLWIPPDDPPPIPPPPPVTPPIPVSALPMFYIPPPPPETQVILGFGGMIDYTWHLSVVDAGTPRGDTSPIPMEALVWRSAAFSNAADWQSMRLRGGRWTLPADAANDRFGGADEFDFGIYGGIPVAGDFNGDGVDEVAIYYKGRWFLDLNGNGVWDDEDLWAQLGDEFDLPVTGDWNGDGKDDIGIFGPAWLGDPRALAVEHGLPDLQNVTTPFVRPKNVPPELKDATDQLRYLQRTPHGDLRADVIDHVFHYGNSGHVPVTGDWTGDGIKNIGIFRHGYWVLDADGDGRLTSGDWQVQYGRAGDLPVVGDFDGNGIDEIGVFRSGQWIIDINGNRQMDAHDKVFQMGEAGDRPVAGDWNGDGVDDPAVYRDLGPEADSTARSE